MNSMFNQLLNVKGTVVEGVRIADSPLRPEPVLEIRVRPRRGMLRCSRCGDSTYAYHSREPNPRKQQKPQK